MWPFLLTASMTAVWGVIYAVVLLRGKQYREMPNRLLCWLFAVLPFCSGGYYSFLAIPLSVLLFVLLIRCVRKNGGLRLYANFGSSAIGLIGLVFGISILWAVDKGMAPMGFAEFLPVVLLTLLLMQLDGDVRTQVYAGIPLSGAVMTLASIPFIFFEATADIVSPDNRLAGFMEYPNTFALFLLIGIVLALTREQIRKRDFLLAAISMFGIFLSGSRTTFILLVLCVVVICLVRKNRYFLFGAAGVLVVALVLSTLIGESNLFQSASRYLTTTTESSTLLARLVYFFDALKVIATHPLGLGSMGYANLQGSFQTGVYHVTYVHNELLQLLLDVGWIPVIVLILAFVTTFFKKGAGCRTRLMMLVILAHCMMDFDLQFLSIWFILVTLLELQTGREFLLKKGKGAAAAIGAAALALTLWLGTGDFLYHLGWTEACLKVMPFHTMALMRELPDETDLSQLENTADRIIALNSHISLAYSAKANAAYASGDIKTMISSKKLAIENNRYVLEEYTDYFDKLYTAMQLYVQQGDSMSAEICRQEILKIPKMLSNVLQETNALAWIIQHVPELELPQEYIDILNQLESS